MSDDPFRLLQAGKAHEALACASAICAAQPDNARARLAAGIALRALGRIDESRQALGIAAMLAPADYAPPYELGVLEAPANPELALAHFERSASLRPAFAAAHFGAGLAAYRLRQWQRASRHFGRVVEADAGNVEAMVNLGQCLAEEGRREEGRAMLERAMRAAPASANARYAMGWLLRRLGQRDEAASYFAEALERDPRHVEALRDLGRHFVSRAEYERAGALFSRAAAIVPADPDLPLYIAQALLLAGRWSEAWPWYARRDSRLAFEAAERAVGRTYRIPGIEELRGREAWIVGEQGLGDILFFLRFAPALRGVVERLGFAGEPRLHSILSRTGVFDAFAEAAPPAQPRVLAADLPAMLALGDDVFASSLRAPPEASRERAMRERLSAAGERPWIVVTWRSGTPREKSQEALSKSVPPDALFAALSDAPGTVFAFQRDATAGELEAASRSLGRTVHDLSREAGDVEDALALVALADRHVAVSSTNMHLAALAGRSAEVLVPFPPEWRWRPSGESPWFPGFRVLRQHADGDWSPALAALAR